MFKWSCKFRSLLSSSFLPIWSTLALFFYVCEFLFRATIRLWNDVIIALISHLLTFPGYQLTLLSGYIFYSLIFLILASQVDILINIMKLYYSLYWWSAYIVITMGVSSSYLDINKNNQNYCRRVSKSQPPSKNAHWLLWISAIYSAYNWRMICQKRNDTLVKKIKKINHSTKNKCNKSAPKRRKLPLNRWILNAQLPFVLIIIFFV